MPDGILLIFATMGVGEDPLYWGKILSRAVLDGLPVNVLVGQQVDPRKLAGCAVAAPLRFVSLFGLAIPSFLQIFQQIIKHRGLCVISEFNLTSAFALIICRFHHRRPVLLLVENHAKYLRGYGIARKGMLLLSRRIMAKAATMILTNNEQGFQYVTGILEVPESKVVVGPYLTSALPKCAGAEGSRTAADSRDILRLAAIGQLIRRKGYDLLIQELALLPPKLREKVRLSIFGSGPEAQALQGQIDAEGLSGIVTLEGHVAYEALGERLADFNCFVISTRADYRSLVSFEAISLGLPLLMSTHDGAVIDVLEEGTNGYSFDPEVSGELAAAVQRVLDSMGNLDAMSRASQRIATRFTVERAANVLADAALRTARISDRGVTSADVTING